MHPIAILSIIVLAVLVVFLPRKYAMVPLMLAASYLNASAGLQIGPAHLPPFRLLVILSLLRETIRGQIEIKWNGLDRVFILYSATLAIACSLRLMSFEGVNWVTGLTLDVTGGYLIARICMPKWDDVIFFVKCYAILMIPFAFEMTIEQLAHYNLFNFVGAPVTSYVREGRYRAYGTFGPILSGTFGAIGAILSIPLWMWAANSRKRYAFGIFSGMVITVAGATSGAVMTLFYGLVALGCWYIRGRMRFVRIGIVLLIAALALFMKAPVWYLIARISDVLGGTGWHRSFLIDQAIRYFRDWWMLGITHTGYWMPYQLSDGNSDITNQFLQQGVTGGIVPMVLYVIIIVMAFRYIGIGLKNSANLAFKEQFMIWGLGCALFGHTATFFNVSYYNNVRIFFSFLLAAIALLRFPLSVPDWEPEEVQASS